MNFWENQIFNDFKFGKAKTKELNKPFQQINHTQIISNKIYSVTIKFPKTLMPFKCTNFKIHCKF